MNSIFYLQDIISEARRSIKLALPLIATEIIYTLSSFIATLMVAHMNKEHLAANALVLNIYFTVVVFTIGILRAVSIMVSQSFGAKDNRSISVCFKQGLIVAFIFTPLMILIMWFAPIILVLTGQDLTVIDLAKPFFRSLIWLMLPINIAVVINQFLIGINKIRIVMLMSILIVPIQILFFYVFLFGKFWFPKLGLAGIGYGLTVSHCLVTSILFCYLYFSKGLKKYHLFHNWWLINKKFLFELIRVGLPLGFMFGAEVALFAVIAIMMGVLGTTALAAHQIAYQYFMLAVAFICALTQTTTIRVGNEVGRDDKNALKLAVMVNMGISFVFVALLSVIYIGFPNLVIGLDVDIHEPHLQALIKQASTFLLLVGVVILIESFRLTSFGALRGLKDTRFSMFVSVFGFWCIAFPCAHLLGFKFKFGGAGIWWGLIIGLFIIGIIFFIRFNYLIKRIDLESLVTKP